MTDQRAKDLASIEPPSSMKKIVSFAEQLSFGQDALFAGTELPKPHIGQNGVNAGKLARQMSVNPYSIFPGVGSEGLDSVMSRQMVRTRDIQDFTRWLMKFDAKRSELVVYDTPEQIFFQHATPELAEQFMYQHNPEIEQIIREGRRRRTVTQEIETEEIEVRRVETRRKRIKTEQVETLEAEEESAKAQQAHARSAKQGDGAESAQAESNQGGQSPAGAATRRNMLRRDAGAEPSSDANRYWRDSGPRMDVAKTPPPTAAQMQAEQITFGQVLTATNRNLLVSNFGMSSLAGGIIRGRADAAASFQAQSAASSAVQSSPVAGTYMPQGSGSFAGQVPSHAYPSGVYPSGGMAQSHFQAPEVSITSQPLGTFRPSGAQSLRVNGVEVTSDWDGGPGMVPPPGMYTGPESAAIPSARAAAIQEAAVGSRSMRGAAVAGAALLGPMAFAALPAMGGGLYPVGGQSVAIASMTPLQLAAMQGRGSSYVGVPGYAGAVSESMAMNLASRANASAGLGGVPMLIGDGSVMPAGQVERKDVMGMGFVGGAHPSAIARGIGSFEPGVQTSIPNSPLMGQITLIAPPMEVASAEAERAGTAVSFDVKTLAKGAGALDATSLTMLKSAMPQGLQAIYPALPQSQLGPHAVNMKLAPSLLGQILNEGYGGRAAQMTPHFADAASKVSLSSPVAMPMEASIVPVTSRPVGDQAGLLGAAGGTEKGLGQIGAGGASRGGALDFLGMPVRLAPSLAGSPEMSAAAEARKAMPPGAAAVMRPNEFAPLRSKLFPAFGSVKAEPDQKAWEKAAPSYGMRSARPENLLSPEARLKPPAGGASVPQMHTVSPTATAKALAGAAAVSSIADAAMPSGLHALSSSAMAGGALGAFAGGGLAAMGQAGPLGMISGLRGSRGGVPAVPSLGSVMSLARPNPLMAAGFAGRFAGGMAAPAMSFGSPTQPGMSPSVMSQRVASRWSPAAPMGKGLGLPSLSSTVPATPHSPGIPSVKTHTKSSNGPASPQMPRMRPGIPATPSMTQSLSSSAPAMTDSPIPTTAGAHPGISNLAAPAPATLPKIGGESASVRERPKSSILAHQAPAMPIAASVAAAKPTASSTFVQRAQMNEGIATAPNSSIQEPEHSSSRTTKDPGQAAHEINMLANEVWTLLRRKLTFEAERMGRR